MQEIVNDVVETLSSERTKKKIESDRKKQNKSSTKETLFSRQVNRENAHYVEAKQGEQKCLHEQQDAVLDDMSAILSRLDERSRHIEGELIEHNMLLDEMDGNMDEANQRLKTVISKTEKLLGKSNRGKYTCILMEVMIIIILILLIMYL